MAFEIKGKLKIPLWETTESLDLCGSISSWLRGKDKIWKDITTYGLNWLRG